MISSVASIEGGRPGIGETPSGRLWSRTAGAALVDDDDVVALVGTSDATVPMNRGRLGSAISPPQPWVTSMTTTLIAAIERFTIRPYATSDEGRQRSTSSPSGSSSEQQPNSAQGPCPTEQTSSQGARAVTEHPVRAVSEWVSRLALQPGNFAQSLRSHRRGHCSGGTHVDRVYCGVGHLAAQTDRRRGTVVNQDDRAVRRHREQQCEEPEWKQKGPRR